MEIYPLKIEATLEETQSNENILVVFYESKSRRSLCTMADFTLKKKREKKPFLVRSFLADF